MNSNTIHYQHCPVCNSQAIEFVFHCRDFTVSSEEFPVWQCNSCTTRFTQDVPAKDHIGAYYASENYISHSNTNRGLVSKLYKLARRYAMRQKVANVQKVSGLRQGSMLDVGCGIGAFVHAMQQAGWKATGLEPDAGARSKAKEMFGIEVMDARALTTLPDAEFDVITLWHVLEHIHDLHHYFEQFNRLLQPNGILLVAVPNYLSKDALQYGSYWAAYDVPRHLYHFTPQSLETLAGLHLLHLKQVQPMWLDAFYISLLSEKYRYGKQRLVQAFTAGWKSVWHARNHAGTCSSQVYVLQRKNEIK